MAVSRLSLTNSMSLGPIQPALTYPVKPVSRVTDVTSKKTIAVSDSSDNKTLDRMSNSFSSMEKLSYNENNPYDASRKSAEYSLVSGLNFDETI